MRLRTVQRLRIAMPLCGFAMMILDAVFARLDAIFYPICIGKVGFGLILVGSLFDRIFFRCPNCGKWLGGQHTRYLDMRRNNTCPYCAGHLNW